MSVDLFWCESAGPVAKQLATEALRLRDSNAGGRWRTRMLPDDINQRDGYRISGFRIRIDASEQAIATSLKARLDLMISPAAFEVVQVRTPTPGYLSVFFCKAP